MSSEQTTSQNTSKSSKTEPTGSNWVKQQRAFARKIAREMRAQNGEPNSALVGRLNPEFRGERATKEHWQRCITCLEAKGKGQSCWEKGWKPSAEKKNKTKQKPKIPLLKTISTSTLFSMYLHADYFVTEFERHYPRRTFEGKKIGGSRCWGSDSLSYRNWGLSLRIVGKWIRYLCRIYIQYLAGFKDMMARNQGSKLQRKM